MVPCFPLRKGEKKNSINYLVAGGEADDGDITATLPSMSRPINHYVEELFNKGYSCVFVRFSSIKFSLLGYKFIVRLIFVWWGTCRGSKREDALASIVRILSTRMQTDFVEKK